MAKKGIELSLNTIIIAAIALIVLVVLVILFARSSGNLTRGLNDCAAKGGQARDCEPNNAQCAANGGVPNGPCIFYDDDGKPKTGSITDYVCCVYNRDSTR